MAIRTYIPAIRVVAEYLKKFVNENSTKLKKNMGDALFALVVLVVDLLIIVTSLIDGNHAAGDAWSDFSQVNSMPSNRLNEIAAAIAKFYESIGVTP